MNWQEIIVEPLKAMATRVAEFLPNMLGALVILVVGWAVARGIRYVVHRGLRTMQLDTVTENVGVNKALRQGNIEAMPSLLIAKLFYWIVFILTLGMAVNALGLTVAAQLLNSLLLYLPNVIAAAFILVLGFFFGSLVRGLVQTALAGSKALEAQTVGKISQGAVVVFAVAAALVQLRIAEAIVTNAFTILFAAIAFGVALAFGLGCKDLVRGWVEDLVKK